MTDATAPAPVDARARVIGHAVFGTSRGLFASGDGVLAGISNSPQAFELRGDDGAPPLKPGEMLLFRDTFAAAPDGLALDVVGIVMGALDSARRPGFFGICAAVAADDGAAYREAYEGVVGVFREARACHLSEDNGVADGVAPFFRPTEGDREGRRRTYAAVQGVEGLILQADWGEEAIREQVFEVFEATAFHHAGRQRGVVVSERPLEGSRRLDADLLAALRAQADALRADLARQAREREAREAEARARAEAEAEARAAAFRRENEPTPELIARMRGQIADLQAETKALRRELAPRAAAAPASRPLPSGGLIGRRRLAPSSSGRRIAALVIAVSGVVLAAVFTFALFWPRGETETPEAAADVPAASAEPEPAPAGEPAVAVDGEAAGPAPAEPAPSER